MNTSGKMHVRSADTLRRMMLLQGIPEGQVQRGLDYAAEAGAKTTREMFVLAMSRVTLSDAELTAGIRFIPR